MPDLYTDEIRKEPLPIEDQPHEMGRRIWPECYEIDQNELALLLVERNENRPDFRGFRRYQTIFVKRGDGLAKYMEDMGPAEAFIAGGLDVIGGDPGKPRKEWILTVGELKDHANGLRQWLTEQTAQREVPDLIAGVHDDIDMENLERRHSSQFGPLITVERG